MIPPARFTLVAAFAFMSALAGCERPDVEEPPLRIVALSLDVAEAMAAQNIAHGLTARDAGGQVIPGLAQSWRVSDDGLSIVFRLREARFADGRAVAAGDVTASLADARRRASPQVQSLLSGIAKVAAPLPDVVEIVLSTPQPEFLELLAHPELAIRPRGRGPLRAGPFTRITPEAEPEAGQDGPAIELQRSDNFHDSAAIVIAGAEIRVASPDEAIAAFRSNAADIVTGGALDGLGSARIAGGTDILRLETSRTAYTLLLNQTSGPLADRRVRLAMAMAIDRERIGPQLFGTTAAAPVPALAPPAARGERPAALPDWQALSLMQRRDEALRLLAEAGHGPDNRLSLTVSATGSAADEQLLSLVAADLAAIGVDITLGRRSATAHDEAVVRGDFALALVLRRSPIASAVPFLEPLRCGRNRHGSCLKEADALMAKSWTAPTPTERMALLASAERLWAEDAAAIGIVQPVHWSLVSGRVTGWTANPAGVHPLRFLSVSPERKLLK